MSDQDIKEHLGEYGAWLQRSSGLELSPSVEAEGSTEPITAPKPRRVRRVALIAAATAAAFVAVAAAVTLRDEPTGFVVAAAGQDPPGPLYVLPAPLSPDTVHNAQVAEAGGPDPRFGTEIIVVGVPSGTGAYTDLATIWVDAARPGIEVDAAPLELASGPAELWDDLFTIVVQDREGTTILVMADRGRVDYASTIVDSLTIDSAGSASVATDGEFEVIEAATFEDGASPTSTYLDVASSVTTDGGSITVETATSPSPLLGAGALGGRLSATRIQGVEGWVIARSDADGEWNGLAWQATPGRIIAVSGHAPLDAIQAVAESLVIVGEDEWKTALPNHTTG